MARVDLPHSEFRRRRRRRRWFIAGGVFLAVCVLFGGMVWLSWASPLRITAVEVVDAKTVASSSIVAYAQQKLAGTYWWIFPRNNIFLYPRGAMAQGLLARYPSLRAADVHARDFHTVVVTVTEREPVALWCGASPAQPQPCLFLDEEGAAYAPAPNFSAPVYVPYYGALAQGAPPRYLDAAQFQSLFALVAALEQQETTDAVAGVSVDASNDARVLFDSGFTLIFNLKDDGGDIFERFNLALSSSVFTGKTLADFEYLDLRFGDKLYYKLK